MFYLGDTPVKVENIALGLVIPDWGLVLQLQQPLQVLTLVLLYRGKNRKKLSSRPGSCSVAPADPPGSYSCTSLEKKKGKLNSIWGFVL